MIGPAAQSPGRTVLLVLLILLLDGYDMQVAAFAAPALRQEWQLEAAALGPVLAAALVGMAIGTALGGMIGDRFGRRPALLMGAAAFGALALVSAFAGDAFNLSLLRFLTGVGLGVVIPNATALVAEVVPAKWRNAAVTAVVVAVPLGGMCGAALSSWVIPAYGWRAGFALGGLLPLLLWPALWRWLPESPQFGVLLSADQLSRGALLAPPVRRLTLGLWLAFFSAMLVLYSYLSWLPVLLVETGLAQQAAIRGSMIFNLCGVAGALAGTVAIARRGSRPLLLGAAALALVATWAVAVILSSGPNLLPVMAAIGLAGAAVLTIQVTLYALAAAAYPVAMRARGVGWAATIGRLGAILSAAAGGLFLQRTGDMAFFLALSLGLTLLIAATFIIDRHLPGRA